MRLVFMGTPEFAVPSLEKLANKHDVCAVITAPDKPAGRGKKIAVSAVKAAALKLGIPVLQPTNLKAPAFTEELSSFNADLFVVVAFRMLPESVWGIPPKGTINLHASLLPDYRGAAPINRAIIDGQTESGLTTFFIEKDIDTGAVIAQVKMPIGPDENAGSLHDRMMERGADLLLTTVDSIQAGTTNPMTQKALIDKMQTLNKAPKIFKEDCEINWSESAKSVHNLVRGLSPYPGAWTTSRDVDGNPMVFKVFALAITASTETAKPGTIEVRDSQILVRAGDAWLEVLEIQAPGKKRMKTADFLRGFHFPEAWAFK